jgi:hypothetical protein
MTPDQAEKLALAEEMGSIRLVLRPEDDLTVNHLGGANSKQLMTGASAGNWPKPPSPPGSFSAQASVTGSVSRRKGVEVIQGIDKSMVNFN